MINLTPHAITVVAPDGATITIPPSGRVARVATRAEPLGDAPGLPGVPLVRHVYGPVEGLPDEDEPVLVSALVLAALREQGTARRHVYAPDTSPGSAVRDEAGQIIGVRRLATL